MITRRTDHLVFKADLFLKPPKQYHMDGKVRRIAKGHYEVRGLPEIQKPYDWLSDWQENNER